MSDVTLEALAGEVRERMDTLSQQITDQVSDARLTEIIKTTFPQLVEAGGPTRKVRFATEAGDDKLKGSKYGSHELSVADVEFLHDVLESAESIGRSSGPSEELRNVVRDVSLAVAVPSSIARADDERKLAEMRREGILDEEGYGRAMAAVEQTYGTRAMDTAEAGFGLELIGNQYVRELWKGAEVASRVFGLIRRFPMTDATAYLPVQGTPPEMIFVAENTANNSSEYGTQKTASNRVQVDAKKFLIHQMWSGEMEEDSLIPFIAFLREEAARSLAHYSDSLVLNGDTTNAGTGNINLDDADPADTKHYLAFDGIRHAGIVDNTNNKKDAAGAITYGLLLNQRGRMLDVARLHDWGHPDDPNDLIYVCDPETGDQIDLLDEIVTADKFGAQATVLNGQQSRIGRHPLISSQAVSKTEADGKVSTTAANNTKGQVVAFNRRGFVVGERRALKVETERLPGRDQNRIVFSLRAGFGRFTPTGNVNAIESADVLYNIALPA